MNNQIILLPNHYILIKINKINKINKNNKLKIILNLKYIWKALTSCYLFRREKNKPIRVQSRAQLIFKKNQKK